MKHLFLILSLTAYLSSSMAQKQWQLRLGGGYDFSTAPQYMLTQSNSNGYIFNTQSVNSSLNRGLGLNADITWWVSRYFGFTAGAAYHNTQPAVKGHSSFSGLEYGSQENNKWHSRTVLATAGIALKIPGAKFTPYMRMGMLLPVYSRLTNESDWKSYGMIGVTYGTSEKVYRLRNTVGYNAAVGIAPALSKHIAVFAEIRLQSLAVLARHSELTSNMVNGVEQIKTYNTYSRETDYVKKTVSYTYDPDKPQQQPTFSFPYSSIGIHIGVSFKL